MSEIIYGIYAIQSILERDPHRLLDVYVLKNYNSNNLKKIIHQIRIAGIIIQFVRKQWIDSTLNQAIHQGILARVKKINKFNEHNLQIILDNSINPLILVLDRITDPHNLGACLRSADAAGVHAVIVPKNHSAKLNATVKKVASGAADSVPLIYVTNLVRTICMLKDYNILVVGTTEKSDHSLYKIKLNGPIALVLGSEDKGIRLLTKKYCDMLISIPMVGSVSSLNVSVASGVCLFEIMRQRLEG